MASKGIDGKIALVTGGTSGIGLAIATGVARAGVKVVLLARNRAWGRALNAALSPSTSP